MAIDYRASARGVLRAALSLPPAQGMASWTSYILCEACLTCGITHRTVLPCACAEALLCQSGMLSRAGTRARLHSKQGLLAALVERVRDGNAYTRARTLQTWGALAEAAAIPLGHWVCVTELAVGAPQVPISHTKPSLPYITSASASHRSHQPPVSHRSHPQGVSQRMSARHLCVSPTCAGRWGCTAGTGQAGSGA